MSRDAPSCIIPHSVLERAPHVEESLYAILTAMSFGKINHSGQNFLRQGRESVVTAPHRARMTHLDFPSSLT
jgi:hypothetical protein